MVLIMFLTELVLFLTDSIFQKGLNPSRFHVSHLKKQLGLNVAPHVDLLQIADDGLIQNVPLTILAPIMMLLGRNLEDKVIFEGEGIVIFL